MQSRHLLFQVQMQYLVCDQMCRHSLYTCITTRFSLGFFCDCYELSQLMAGDVTINLYMHDILPQNGLNVNLHMCTVFISIPYSITGWQRGWTSSGCDNRNIRPDLSYLGSHVPGLHSCPRLPPLPPIHSHTHPECTSTH